MRIPNMQPFCIAIAIDHAIQTSLAGLTMALVTAFNMPPVLKSIALVPTIPTIRASHAARMIRDYETWCCVGFETLERGAPFAPLKVFAFLLAHHRSACLMTATKDLAELEARGQRVYFHELTDRLSVEKGTNIVSNNVILQIQDGAYVSGTAKTHAGGARLPLVTAVVAFSCALQFSP
jgi:hypothetical protein